MMNHSNASAQLLTAENVGKRVNNPGGGELIILEDVSFSLRQGDATAIVGSSGSGKSTLLGLLAGLDLATSGEIHLLGERLSSLNEDERAALRAGQVGFVFQSFQLLPGMTALENVMLPLELAGGSEPQHRAREALERVGLDKRLQHYPTQLSGGEQQRVAIARAFAPEPRLLFADEPTGSLDSATGRHITDLLFSLQDETGTGLLLVTHDEHLAQSCHQQLHLEAGRLESRP